MKLQLYMSSQLDLGLIPTLRRIDTFDEVTPEATALDALRAEAPEPVSPPSETASRDPGSA